MKHELKDAKALFESVKQAKKSEDETKASGLAAAADTIVDALTDFRLVASPELDEHVALYRLHTDNTLTSISDRELEVLVYRAFPRYIERDRKEVVRFIKMRTLVEAPQDLSLVQPVAFADDANQLTWNRLTLSRADLGAVSLDSLPAFKHILSLCDDPRALVLWIGSLLDPKAGRTQYLHLHGGGGNGKSTLFTAIGAVLGEKHVVTCRADEFSNQHWGSIVEGARLLIFPDENNPGFFGTGKFKEFTGEESTSVNPKYEKPRRIRLTHKTAVFSNNKVEISTSVADRRRLLSVSMADDPTGNVGWRWWYEDLRSSGAQILAYCFHEYTKALAVDPSVRAFITQRPEAIEAAIARKYSEIEDVVYELYEITGRPGDLVSRSEVHGALASKLNERRSNRIFQQHVKEALGRLGIVEGDRRSYVGLKAVTGISVGEQAKLKVIRERGGV